MNAPIPALVRSAGVSLAMHVEPDYVRRVVIIRCASEPVEVVLAAEAAIDLSLRLTGACIRLQKLPGGDD